VIKKARKEHCAQEKVPQLCPRFRSIFPRGRGREEVPGQALNPNRAQAGLASVLTA
jgi:hypothetical protein